MRGAFRAMSIITTIWTLLVIVFVVLAIISIIPTVVTIKASPPDQWKTTISGDTISVSGNMSIYNGGFFKFSDFYFVVQIYNENGTTIASFSSNKTDLRPMGWTYVPLTLEFNRSTIGDLKLKDMLFNQVGFGGLIYFDMKYVLGIQTQAGLKSNITIGPVIHAVQPNTNESKFSQTDGNYSLTIPYSLNTSTIWAGHNITINGTISNETQMLGTINQSIPLGTHVQSNFVVNLTADGFNHLSTSSDHLKLNLTVGVDGLSQNYQVERDWQPPSQG